MTAIQYGMLNTSFFSAFQAAWPVTEYGPAPTVEALAIALAMPSVERSGQPGSRGSLKAPGLGSYYFATAFRWVAGVEHGCVDRAYTLATGSPSNKQNHMTGLVTAGLVARYRVGGTYQVALTDAGLAQVKLVCPELAKVAKGYTVAARDAALKAFIKASKPVKAKAKRKVKRTYTATPADIADGIPPVMTVEVPVETVTAE